ncbi:protein KTI12 homolog [Episyrphus balteatus]|uniref:protein KTI12 homolog n=1 Tax=Episyrphus balteatus TaxID=286459 RepID=UPI002484E997|nr:protein KTI12 homolog [Episyrphus balteatus]
MPLIIISGFPSSGKTTRAKQLQEFLTTKGKQVKLISENAAIPKAGFKKNVYYADSQKEKIVRSDLKSEAIRLLNKDDVVILDAGNYIKGYRYELFCATKAARGTQCTLFCGIQKDKAWEFNCQRTEEETNLNADDDSKLNNSNIPYTREIFDALCMRFEEPHGNCRWDKPLFVVFPEDQLDCDGIYSSLFDSAPLPPNMSTQNAPISATNYLFEMDQLTQQIVADVMSSRKIGISGPVPVKGSNIKVDLPDNVNAIQLNRLRRQFLNYSKMHSTSSTLDKVPQLFVQFLNSNCKI